MLITEQYRAEQQALHAKGDYGTAALEYGGVVEKLLVSSGARSLLDYGCGSKRSLLQALRLPPEVVYEGYDPGVPEYAQPPIPAELVTCIDVLEHIEPDLLDNVLDHLAELCDPYGFFTIHTGPARKTLSDGRNAHLIQQGVDWWMPRLNTRFAVLSMQAISRGRGFAFVVRSLQSDNHLPTPAPLALPEDDSPAPLKEEAAEQATAAKAAATQVVVKCGDQRMVFNTPNGMTAWRVKSLFEKEPDTIRWIAGMAPGSTLLDIGANVGMYSVFAAVTRNVKVFAFEPESQNYALLNANIATNELSDRVLAFPLALSDRTQLDKLYLSKFEAGGSCHSFAEEVGFDLKPRKAAFTQGAFSVTLDQLVEGGAIPVPDYIKLDVDGIEHKVLDGARQTLSNPTVKELLVELNTHLPEHNLVIDRLQALGFAYEAAQVERALRKSGAFEGVGEFIFRRRQSERVSEFSRTFRFTLPAKPRGRAVLHHIQQRIEQTPVTDKPFPYLVVDNVFPDDYYAEMLANFPSHESLRPLGDSGRLTNADSYRERLVVLFTDEEFERMTDAQQRFWRDLASWMYSEQFVDLFVNKFYGALEPRIERIVAAEQALEVKGDSLLVNDCTNYAIGPHTDVPRRLISFLFYLPRDKAMRELGTSVYRPKDRTFTCWGGPHHPFDKFERVATVDFLPNRLMAFPKTERSFHGVEPIKRANVNRPLLIHNIRLLNNLTH